MAPGSSEHRQACSRSSPANCQPARLDSDNQGWIQVTEIDDDDLQFGGKSLSEWYEEERRRLSHGASSSDEEEHRGRQRVRKHYSSQHHGNKHGSTSEKKH